MEQTPLELTLSLFSQFWREPDVIVDRMDRASITVPKSGSIIIKMATKLTEMFPYPEGVLSKVIYDQSIEQLARFFQIELSNLRKRLQKKGIPFIQLEVQEGTKNQMIYLLTISAALEIVHLRASERINQEIMLEVRTRGLNETSCKKKLQDMIYVADSTYSLLVNVQILQMYATFLNESEDDGNFNEIKQQLLSLVVEKLS